MTAEHVRQLVEGATRYTLPPKVNGSAEDRDAPAERPAWNLPPAITCDEMASARLAPRCIVDDYLFADVAELVAPGGTSKTTVLLYEAVHIVLGRPLWGLRVAHPGPVLVVTAEDRRERLVARLREICGALRLTESECERVRALVRIDDCTTDVRRLTAIVADVVTASGFAEMLVGGCTAANFAPAVVAFDPLVSFGVGEARVNDAEQALVEAGRIIVGGLDCCVRFIHHTGKGPAQDQRTDQYVGRGGSALADGCRMVHVLQALDGKRLVETTGETLAPDQSAFALMRPKLSYAPPQRAPLYIRRCGYAFELLRPLAAQSDDERQRMLAEQLARFLEVEFHSGRRHTRHTLEQLRPDGLSRPDVRAGIAWLHSAGRLVDVAVVDHDGKRPAAGARTYLRVCGEPMAHPLPQLPPENTVVGSPRIGSPPIGDGEAARRASLCSPAAAPHTSREVAKPWRGDGERGEPIGTRQ